MDLVTMILACSLYPDNAILNAMVELNSQNNPLMVSGKPFKSAKTAEVYVQAKQASQAAFEIGLLQIPSQWVAHRPVSIEELLRPCKNMIVATQILNETQLKCQGDVACALSLYKTGDPQAGLNYAQQIIQYASEHPFKMPVTGEE